MEREVGFRALAVRGSDSDGIEILDLVDLARYVRTQKGVKRFHLPIGSLIVGHPDHPDEIPAVALKPGKHKKAKAAVKTAWAFGPGEEIGEQDRAGVLDHAPLGTTVVVEPVKGGLREVWTKVPNSSDKGSHWESVDPSGSTQIAHNGQQVVSNGWQEERFTVPPNFGGDIDKVLHPKDGDTIAYYNAFDEEPEWHALTFDIKTGMFRTGEAYSGQTPRFLMNRLAVMGEHIRVGHDDRASRDYLFWAADADRLDAEFRSGKIDPTFTIKQEPKPLDVPTGWSQVTPREAFPDDSEMAIGYYARAARSSALRLFKGQHDETVVVDDVNTAENLKPLLAGVAQAMDFAKDAPGVKDPNSATRKMNAFQSRQRYLTFTVGEEWPEEGSALAFVRNSLPDDVQVNPALVTGTFDSGGEVRALRLGTPTPYRTLLRRLTEYKNFYRPKNPDHPGERNWWTPAVGLATDNIFTATLTHELGHVNDGRRLDTSAGGFDADPRAIKFWKDHRGLSAYANTNASEGYAEAFAEWFAEQRLRPAQRAEIPGEIRKISAAYAVEYGWKVE